MPPSFHSMAWPLSSLTGRPVCEKMRRKLAEVAAATQWEPTARHFASSPAGRLMHH